MNLDILSAPLLSEETNSCTVKLNWDCLKSVDLEKYCNITDNLLNELKIDSDTFLCTDLMCKNHNHLTNTTNLYEGTVNALIKGSGSVFNSNRKKSF